MNNSGSAVSDYRPENLIVVHDDLDLEAGTVRVKVGGGAGGHNGLRSIIGRLGNDFVRVRIGIGRPPAGVTVTDYVLSRMDPVVAGGHNAPALHHREAWERLHQVRIGIGRPPAGVGVTDYVLSRMDSVVKDAIPTAADAVEVVLSKAPKPR